MPVLHWWSGVVKFSIAVTGYGAGGLLFERVEGISSAGGTLWLGFNHAVGSEEIGIGRCFTDGALLIQRPLAFGALNRSKVALTSTLLRNSDSVLEARNGDGREESDDGDHDHDFDKGECVQIIPVCVHNVVS